MIRLPTAESHGAGGREPVLKPPRLGPETLGTFFERRVKKEVDIQVRLQL